MQRLLPDPAPEDGSTLYADVAAEPPWVAIGMVASIDGAAAVDGVSGALGSAGDQAAFRGLRALADVIVVGAGTARAEGYGPAQVHDAYRASRSARGQAERPLIAVVTRSLDLRGVERLLAEPGAALVVTCAVAPAAGREQLAARGVDVVLAGETDVEPTRMIAELAGRGLGRVVCEGGPTLNRALLAAGVVDELFLTIAPQVVAGGAGRIVAGAPLDVGAELLAVREHDGELLLRYRFGRSADG